MPAGRVGCWRHLADMPKLCWLGQGGSCSSFPDGESPVPRKAALFRSLCLIRESLEFQQAYALSACPFEGIGRPTQSLQPKAIDSGVLCPQDIETQFDSSLWLHGPLACEHDAAVPCVAQSIAAQMIQRALKCESGLAYSRRFPCFPTDQQTG